MDHTDQIIRDVLIAGIYDMYIRRDTMSVEDIVEKPVNDVVSYIEKKEMARDANLINVNSSAISGIDRRVIGPLLIMISLSPNLLVRVSHLLPVETRKPLALHVENSSMFSLWASRMEYQTS